MTDFQGVPPEPLTPADPAQQTSAPAAWTPSPYTAEPYLPTPYTAELYPSTPPAPRPTASDGRPERRRGMLAIAGVAILSATLAAGGTAALVAGPLAPASPTGAAGAPAAVVVANGPSGANATSAPDLTAVVAAVRDSVVTITSEGFSSRGFAQIPSSGVGSGVVLTADGYILTNKHVVAGSQSLTVELADGRQFPATIVKESDDKDLALIKIDGDRPEPRHHRRLLGAPGRPDGDRHRQPARHLHRDRDQGHPVRDRAHDHGP